MTKAEARTIAEKFTRRHFDVDSGDRGLLNWEALWFDLATVIRASAVAECKAVSVLVLMLRDDEVMDENGIERLHADLPYCAGWRDAIAAAAKAISARQDAGV